MVVRVNKGKREMYGIKHQKSELYFAGFKNNGVVWTNDKNQAKTWGNELSARAQASLLVAQRVKVQRKPIFFKEV